MPNFKADMQPHPFSETHLKVGSKVTYTNDYGVSFSGMTIQGFPTKADSTDKAYIDSDCYWFPKHFNSLTVEEKPNFFLIEWHDLTATHLVTRAISCSKPITQLEFNQLITAEKLESARAAIAATYAKHEMAHMAEAIKAWEFKNPRIGISDNSLGRLGCLTLLVELGEELVAFDAGKAWNHILDNGKKESSETGLSDTEVAEIIKDATEWAESKKKAGWTKEDFSNALVNHIES